MSAIKIYSNDSLLIVMWDHRPPGRFAPHDKICDILRVAIKSRISADMLSLRIWYSVIIHITYSLLHTCNFFQMLMQINRSNWGHLQKGALCPMLLYNLKKSKVGVLPWAPDEVIRPLWEVKPCKISISIKWHTPRHCIAIGIKRHEKTSAYLPPKNACVFILFTSSIGSNTYRYCAD